MNTFQETLHKWVVKISTLSPWSRRAKQRERLHHQDDIARWVDDGGPGDDPRRTAT